MQTTRNHLLIATSVFVVAMLTPQSGWSQPRYWGPSGHWTHTVSDPRNAVWDATALSDVMNLSLELIDRHEATNASLTCPIAFLQLGNGALRGRGSAIVHYSYKDADLGWINVDPFEARYMVTGKLGTSAGNTRGWMRSTVSGRATIEGANRGVRGTHGVRFTFDNLARTCSTVVSDQTSFPGPPPVTSPGPKTRRFGPIPLSTFMAGDGSWTLDMTLSTTGRKVVGSGFIALNSGSRQFYSVKGVYKPVTQQSTLVLTGTGLSKGSNLEVIMNADTVTVIKGKICGQLVSVAN